MIHEIHILIFQGSPQALRKYVVHTSSSAIHDDINHVILDHCGEGIAGKLGPLVAIEYFRFSELKAHFQRLQTKCRIHRYGCLPGKDIAAPPVYDHHQIHEPSIKRNISDVGSLNLILPINDDVPEQARINLVPRMRLA